MIINHDSLATLFTGFKGAFQKGFDGAESHAAELAMDVSSQTSEELYAWLGAFPRLREWIGDRVVQNLSSHRYSILNRKFEVTVEVERTKIEDDQYGVYTPMMQELGRVTRQHPDELLFGLLASGFSKLCYDGQYFFDTDHPVGGVGDFPAGSVSNFAGGSDAPWYLLDLSRAVRPLIWQTRIPYSFTKLDDEKAENVFWRDQYIYGVRARANAGFGLWQLAYASKQPLTRANYAAARTAMRTQRSDNGNPLGIKATHLLVPPGLEEAALYILNAQNDAAGASNVWQNTCKLIVAEWLM